MALQIVNAGPDPKETIAELQRRIETAIPDSEIEIRSGGPGHFEISVTAAIFEGQSRVKQQQLVYGAITELMAGNNPPVHAVDKLECRVP
jgi:acid stress-induced BolA-like protein IbaG/YrbA